MIRYALPLALALAAAAPLFGQSSPPDTPASSPPDSPPPSADSLAAVSRRGRAIAEADHIVWLASGAIESPYSPSDSIRRSIARRTNNGWEVAVGELSDDGATYLISRLATPGIQPDVWASSLFEPALPDTGYFARAARAIESSLIMFRPVEQRPYIAMVLPEDDGPSWHVYLYPAPTVDGIWPRGGDMRFRVSADGRIVTEARRLHETIAEYSVRTARSATTKPGDGQPAVSGNAPEDTDVFHVIQRRPALPELMTVGRFQYQIDVDGGIRLLNVR